MRGDTESSTLHALKTLQASTENRTHNHIARKETSRELLILLVLQCGAGQRWHCLPDGLLIRDEAKPTQK